MVLITVALVVVQEMCARLGAYTGEGLGALIREQFCSGSRRSRCWRYLLANVGLVVSEFAGIAAALELLGVCKYVQHSGRGGRDLGAGGLRRPTSTPSGSS